MKNYAFELEQQNFYFNEIVDKIINTHKDRVLKADQQEQNLE
jgi:hypothetical protein